MRTWLIDEQWVYAPFKGYAGAVTWAPIALVDRCTGKVYSLIRGLTNAEAAALVRGRGWGSE